MRLVEAHGFYRAYNKSAYLFHSCIAQHKVVRKFIKVLKESVVYVGFPADKLMDRLGGRAHEKTAFGYDVVMKPDEIPDYADYERWLGEVPTEVESKGDVSALPLTGLELKAKICRMIQEYPLDRRTPVEAMNFIASLKDMLDRKEE